MRIRVDEIPDSGRFLHFHWSEDRLNDYLEPDDPFELKLIRPVNVDLEIRKGADHIRIEGAIRGTLQVACHRCLMLFPLEFNERVDLFLIEEREDPETAEDEEKEFEAQDFEYEFFDGEVIDVDQLVSEQIFLSLPYKVLCTEDCRGICPRCGANLNEESCRCKNDGEDSPFSGLKAIKDQLPQSTDS